MSRKLTDPEKELLKAAMSDVTPLHKKAIAEKPAAPKPVKKMRAASPPIEQKQMPVKGGVDKNTVMRVKRGEYPIEARLDLHGLTLDEAHARLKNFIEQQHNKGRRALLVITGKGGREGEKGKLQREVPRWLALSDMANRILVVSVAQAKHGGQGALYLLLRRKA